VSLPPFFAIKPFIMQQLPKKSYTIATTIAHNILILITFLNLSSLARQMLIAMSRSFEKQKAVKATAPSNHQQHWSAVFS